MAGKTRTKKPTPATAGLGTGEALPNYHNVLLADRLIDLVFYKEVLVGRKDVQYGSCSVVIFFNTPKI